MRAPLLLLVVTVGLEAAPLAAQVPFNACLDRDLQPIPGRVDNSINAGAVATVEDGKPVILWNQHNLSQASSTFQLFVYLHECAHHNLNHMAQLEGRTVEDQADCWAYQLLIDGGMLNGSHRDELTREFRYSTGDFNHLGGEALLTWLDHCLELRVSQTGWARALDSLAAAAPGGFLALRGRPVRGAPDGTFEVTLGTPGTFDCELLPSSLLRCMVFATRKQKDAEKRFDKLRAIIAKWLAAPWTIVDAPTTGGGLAATFAARDTVTGTLLILGLTPESRIYFMMRAPAGPS